jgi:hypothetical protein
MTSASTPDFSSKISPAFASRLAKLKPGQEIRAIVLPAIPPAPDSDGTMARSARRRAVAETMAEIVKTAFHEIDRQFASTGGRRLTHTPNRLGFIHIEAPAASIHALAAQDWVDAIIEDQSVRRL